MHYYHAEYRPIQFIGPLGGQHDLVELWRISDRESVDPTLIDYFPNVSQARSFAERAGPGSYYFTKADGTLLLMLESGLPC